MFCLSFAVRSSTGLDVWNIESKDGAKRQFKPFFNEAKGARAMTCSEHFYAYGNSVEGVKVFTSKMDLKFTVPRTKSHILKISPKESYLIVYEIYTSTKENPDNPNLFIYEVRCEANMTSFK